VNYRRRKKEEGRRKKEEGRRKKEEGRRKKEECQSRAKLSAIPLRTSDFMINLCLYFIIKWCSC
jgi:tRNA nucleotidyltransferase (CCA-adding enzyme)